MEADDRSSQSAKPGAVTQPYEVTPAPVPVQLMYVPVMACDDIEALKNQVSMLCTKVTSIEETLKVLLQVCTYGSSEQQQQANQQVGNSCTRVENDGFQEVRGKRLKETPLKNSWEAFADLENSDVTPPRTPVSVIGARQVHIPSSPQNLEDVFAIMSEKVNEEEAKVNFPFVRKTPEKKKKKKGGIEHFETSQNKISMPPVAKQLQPRELQKEIEKATIDKIKEDEIEKAQADKIKKDEIKKAMTHKIKKDEIKEAQADQIQNEETGETASQLQQLSLDRAGSAVEMPSPKKCDVFQEVENHELKALKELLVTIQRSQVPDAKLESLLKELIMKLKSTTT